MKRITFLVATILMVMSVSGVVAQSRTSYFMEGSYFRTQLNPALAPTRGYLALPAVSGIGINQSTNFMSWDNFVYDNHGEPVTALHGSVPAETFLSRIPEVGKISSTENVSLFGLGFYTRRIFWNLGVEANFAADGAVSKDMFTALKTLGNGVYDLGNTAISMTGYLDAYLGASFPVCRWVNVGVKAKFLVGLLHADFTANNISANVGMDSVVGTLRGNWRANGILFENKYITPSGRYETDVNINDISYLLGNVKSYGAAIDLGVEVRLLNEHLKLSAAVTDLGFIKWHNTTHIGGEFNGEFYYNGVNFDTGEVDADADFGDNYFGLSSYDGYTTRLNYSVNVGVEYNILNNHIAFGVLSHTKFCNTMTSSELTASVNFRPTSWLSATFSHTFLNGNRPGVFGAALNIHPAVVNIFLGVDFIGTRYVEILPSSDTEVFPMSETIYIPRQLTSANVYFGFAFNFGRPDHLRPQRRMR